MFRLLKLEDTEKFYAYFARVIFEGHPIAIHPPPLGRRRRRLSHPKANRIPQVLPRRVLISPPVSIATLVSVYPC